MRCSSRTVNELLLLIFLCNFHPHKSGLLSHALHTDNKLDASNMSHNNKWTTGNICSGKDKNHGGLLECHQRMAHCKFDPARTMYILGSIKSAGIQSLPFKIQVISAIWTEITPEQHNLLSHQYHSESFTVQK